MKKTATKKAPKSTKKAAPSPAPAPKPEPMPTDWAGKTPTPEQWHTILEAHARFLRGDGGRARADLSGADLSRANLKDAKDGDLAIARTRILPEGRLIGWKRCLAGVIVKLAIPEEAKRSHAFGRKCRAEFAEVLDIEGAEAAKSCHDSSFVYRVGETVRPKQPWSDEWMEECASGIHFFITRAEAVAYR